MIIAAALASCAPRVVEQPPPPDPRLCVDGHPRPREEVHPHVTYGGLKVTAGYQRDHFIPLGLCIENWCDVAAADPWLPPNTGNPGNVWHQPLPQAYTKDGQEHVAERAYCAGAVTLDKAWQSIIDRWGATAAPTEEDLQ